MPMEMPPFLAFRRLVSISTTSSAAMTPQQMYSAGPKLSFHRPSSAYLMPPPEP